MDPTAVITASKEAIGLVSALAKLIKEVKKRPNTQLHELLDRLQIDAVRLSRDLEYKLRALVERAREYGLDPAASLDQQLADLNWYNVITRSRLKTMREECGSIYRQLTSFLDDATALLLCQHEGQLASTAFAGSLETKRLLDGLLLEKDLPLGKLLDSLLATASRVSAELQST